MGIVGGLLGALFNCINKRLAKYRMKNVHPKARVIRVLESLLVSMVTTVVIFVASMTLGECRDLSPPTTHNSTVLEAVNVNVDVNSTIRQFFCSNKSYNDMATLFFNPQEVAIHQLFHQDATFSPVTLSIFFVLYFLLACWTYGVSVPSGLFVPSLLCGASLGRLVANVLKMNLGMQIYPGTFALIGAAAFRGVVRMTISLTVILIESTNEITYGLPIMITLMDTVILPVLHSVLRDESQWGNAWTFNLGHFLDRNGNFKKKPAFVPSSARKRACVGESLVWMELLLFLVSKVQQFHLSTPGGPSSINTPELSSFANVPHQYQLIVTPR
ncbi:chloride transport protein 6-like [Clupea harengus]|uniref:Chloride transport protein 6-like n=1 Tax=Clupea harengus TaxID=7950 RepID=A0A8M1KKI5_CLUHA|nr:chloride transport protein 6-like [Clupea harengus]